MLHPRIPHRLTLCLLALIGLTTLTAAQAIAQAGAQQPQEKQKQIAEVEKQLAELQKKLDELKKAPEPTTQPDGSLPDGWIKALSWRSIGPANMAGRIVAFSAFEADPSTYWVGTASGGLLKTTNNGVTYEHQFDKEATVSVGDVCVAPSDKNIVWVGTGENNPRNSVSYGDGVYKSTDGGKTWTNVGLKKSFQIGRILIHPKNPDIVYVGALGRLYGPGEERGLYKTTDGGKSWQRILFVDDKTGVIDMRMHPNDPETLIVAMWERERDGFDGFVGVRNPPTGDNYGPAKTHALGGALFKTTDGGKSFKKLTKGLPTVKLGRIGLDYYRKDPNVVFAIIDTEKIGMGPPRPDTAFLGVQGPMEDVKGGAPVTQVTADGPAAKAGLQDGDLILAVGDKTIDSYADLTKAIQAQKPGDKVKLKIKRNNETKELEVTLGGRPAPAPAPAAAGEQAFAGMFGETAENGVRVRFVMNDGPAEQAGLQTDDIITSFAGKPVKANEEVQDLTREHKPGDKIKVKFTRGKETKEVELTLVARPQQQFGGGERIDPTKPFSAQLGGQRENVQDRQGPDGHEYGGIYKSSDGGESWTRINSYNPRPMYFSKIRVDPNDGNNLWILGVTLFRSTDGGKTFRAGGGRGVHADHHTLWIDPRDSRHMIIGCDGGHYVTYDRGENWDHHNTMAIGQFYHVAIDPRRPSRAYGGLQDNGSWGGPTQTKTGTGPINEDWMSIGGGDGFTCRVDPDDPDLIYFTSQNGAMGRRNLRTGETGSIRPRPLDRPGEAKPEGKPETKPEAKPETKPGERGARGQRGPGGPGGQSQFRFNWNSPFFLSSHNSRIFYAAGNYVFRCVDRGNNLRAISPEITATSRGSATALAESPRNPNVLWVGTDDGALWVTRDGGKEWVNVTKNVGLPALRWVSTIDASRAEDGRAYVCFDAHRSDDDKPYLYVTEDFGKTWKSITGNLPAFGSSRCLREDLQNPNLLLCGTEFAVFASLDRGATWKKINNNLPTVAVHEFAFHPASGEVVAATPGRSLWVLDVSPLRQMTAETLKTQAHLFKPVAAVRWQTEPRRGGTNRRFVGENPQPGAQIYYSLAKKAGKVTLQVLDVEGKTVRELSASTEPGLHRVAWTLTRPLQRTTGGRGPGGAAPGRQAGPAGGFGGPGGFGFGQPVPPGTYRVVLNVDGKEFSQSVRVEPDPSAPPTLIAEDGQGPIEEDVEEPVSFRKEVWPFIY